MQSLGDFRLAIMLRQTATEVENDLYDALHIRSMLLHCDSHRIKNNDTSYYLKHRMRHRTSWQRLLDDLSFLCDSRRAGCTTTAVAVEQREHKVIIWLGANSQLRETATSHLRAIVDAAMCVEGRSESEGSVAVLDIVTRAVGRSANKISNYQSRLRNVLSRLSQRIRPHQSWSRLITSMHGILSHGNHLTMCDEAYQIWRSADFRRSYNRSVLRQYSTMYQAQHYVGRLAAWHAAAQRVASSVQHYAYLFQNYEVKLLPRIDPDSPISRTFAGDLEATLRRVLPNYQGHAIFAIVLRRLRGTAARSCLNVDRKLVLRPHAETLMLEHFHAHGLVYANNDRYIGCSKPSCYCCQMYFETHPARARTGRFHGNAWIRWASPRPISLRNGSTDLD
ncbi:hypothetical protein BAUCODRAFT_444772 [Baudoinia panamericana UAMH 10762]|uniref:Uncharacterized protein n=1 Tax=Baudoinia panamericana (strain UAMH 10762) TaxID=717646 RepID=M2LRX6_BAUPA|nr:uncharacterized protein BAUCODRAFT_444772 [Baudoinia panamericana UAMH 10762]EMC97237.1 hypothetical protein BAUCODRAFT_444772 [Baudoinia panamericana UAMH 10762]